MVLKFFLILLIYISFPLFLLGMIASYVITFIMATLWFLFAIILMICGLASIVAAVILIPAGSILLESLAQSELLEMGDCGAKALFELWENKKDEYIAYEPQGVFA